MSSAYAQDGVNVPVGDAFSVFARTCCERTFNNSPFVKVVDLAEGFFRGPRGYTLHGLPRGCIHTAVSDGIGTKVIVYAEGLTQGAAAHDLLEMATMDVVRFGGLPLIFLNVYDARSLGKLNDPDTYGRHAAAMEGVVDAAHKAGVVVLGGETAELGLCVGSENPDSKLAFNWAGFCTGVYHRKKMITGQNLRPGHLVFALYDGSFGSNGISSVRAALARKFGPRWWENPEARDAIIMASAACASYDRFLVQANGWLTKTREPLVQLSAIAHITGGGIVGKFGEDILARTGLSAVLDNLFEPSKIMRDCAEWRNLADREIFTMWHGGQRALVCMAPDQEAAFTRLAMEHGVIVRCCGRIVETDKAPTLTLVSKFTDMTHTYEFKAAA